MSIQSIQLGRLKKAKLAYTPRNIALDKATSLLSGQDITPASGDLVVGPAKRLGALQMFEFMRISNAEIRGKL